MTRIRGKISAGGRSASESSGSESQRHVKSAVTAPQVTSVNYDGSQVVAEWRPVDDPDVIGYEAELYEVGGDGQEETVETGGTRAVFTMQINPANQYELQVGAVIASGGKTPKSDPLTVIDRAPVLDAISYYPPELRMNWTADRDEPGVSAYEAQVYAVDGSFSREETLDDSSFGGTMEVELEATVHYEVRVRGSGDSGVVTGPWSNELAPVVVGPELEVVTYDGSQLTASWSAMARANEYVLQVQRVGGSIQLEEATTDTSIVVELALNPQGSFEARVLAIAEDGRSKGPYGNPLAVIAQAPVFESIAYDGSQLTASWSVVAQAQDYVFKVYAMDGGFLEERITAATSATLELTLDPATSYAAQAMAMADGDRSTGPWSAAVSVIAQAPVLENVAYDRSELTASWAAVDEAGVDAYELRLLDDGAAVASDSFAASPGTLEVTLEADGSYAVEVAATADDAASTGPLSNTLVPIAEAPTGVTLSSGGSTFIARWQPVAETAVTGYLAELYADDTLLSSVGTSLTEATFDDAQAPGVVYSARVRAVGDGVEGPYSAAATGPYLTELTYDYDPLGRLLSVAQSSGGWVAYSYDAAGNILSELSSTPVPEAPEGGKRHDDD